MYGSGTVAVDSVSLDIEEGNVVAIVGPSGCGKSTLLRIIAGLAIPTAGTTWRATAITSNPCSLTMVFQADTLLPWLTVEENAELFASFQPAAIRRRDASARKERVAELMELVGLSAFAHAYPYQLSGGMKRRLAFIAGVAPLPKLLLLDEPFASVDEPTRIQIHQDILRILRRVRMTVVLVTHDLAEAVSLADTVYVMTRGPGRLFSRHEIEFGPERDLLALRHTEPFLTLYGALWRDLTWQLRGSTV